MVTSKICFLVAGGCIFLLTMPCRTLSMATVKSGVVVQCLVVWMTVSPLGVFAGVPELPTARAGGFGELLGDEDMQEEDIFGIMMEDTPGEDPGESAGLILYRLSAMERQSSTIYYMDSVENVDVVIFYSGVSFFLQNTNQFHVPCTFWCVFGFLFFSEGASAVAQVTWIGATTALRRNYVKKMETW